MSGVVFGSQQYFGIRGADQWRQKGPFHISFTLLLLSPLPSFSPFASVGVMVERLKGRIFPFYSVYSPTQSAYIELLDTSLVRKGIIDPSDFTAPYPSLLPSSSFHVLPSLMCIFLSLLRPDSQGLLQTLLDLFSVATTFSV